jgi:hypothetical protein
LRNAIQLREIIVESWKNGWCRVRVRIPGQKAAQIALDVWIGCSDKMLGNRLLSFRQSRISKES